MAAKLERTSTAGIYRRGSRYVFRYRDATGRQRWESTRTLTLARELKRRREVAADDGEHAETKATLADYASQWIDSYPGRTRKGFRESTRREYRRQLEQYLLRFPGLDGKLIRDVRPRDLQDFAGWLERSQDPPLSDATVQRIMAPVKAMFATAFEQDEIRRDAATKVRLSNRDAAKIVDDVDDVKAMTRAQLADFLGKVEPRWRPFFLFLADTGVRISEAIALEWRHVQVSGSTPHVKVRQALVKGTLAAPKSSHGRREIPISPGLVRALIDARRTSEWPRNSDPVFPSMTGTPLTPGNVFARVLQPAADAADVPWIGFHTFRHTCASILFDEGRNVKQVQRWLGHHKASFTLDTYVDLLDDKIGGPLDLAGCDKSAHTTHTDQPHTGKGDIPDFQAEPDSTPLHATARVES
jgi:integrase